VERVHQLRAAAVGAAVASAMLLTACGGGGGTASGPTTASSVVLPSGAPSDLTPLTGAAGTSTDVGGVASIVLPDGSTTEPATSGSSGSQNQVFRMPDADATTKLPAVSVLWQKGATAGALEQSWATEQTRVAQGAKNYQRASVTWPGSVASVVATWDESVPMQDGSTLETEALGLWLQSDDGSVVYAIAFADKGALDDSSALSALRTITLG